MPSCFPIIIISSLNVYVANSNSYLLNGNWGQVLQSYMPLLSLLQTSAHGRIVHAEMRSDLGQPLAMLPIGLVYKYGVIA